MIVTSTNTIIIRAGVNPLVVLFEKFWSGMRFNVALDARHTVLEALKRTSFHHVS